MYNYSKDILIHTYPKNNVISYSNSLEFEFHIWYSF